MRKILVLRNIIRNDSVQEMTIYVALELSIHIFFILGELYFDERLKRK